MKEVEKEKLVVQLKGLTSTCIPSQLTVIDKPLVTGSVRKGKKE